MAESIESFPLISSPQVLEAVRMQFEVSPVLEQLYFLITSIVLTAVKNNIESSVYPSVIPFIFRLGRITWSHNPSCHLMWDKRLVLDHMEDSEALSRLDRLAIHGNPFIRHS